MKLSIVIVNYNVKHFLAQCLISVQRAISEIETEVFVVDNASSDGSVDFIAQQFPWVKLIASPQNLGFSKGNNLAMQRAAGEYVLLLNPDTVVAEDTFNKCIGFMDAHPAAGALGVHMIDGKGNFLPESKRGLPTPAVAFYKSFGLSKLFPKSETFGRYHLGFLPENETHEVEILSGAYMLMRKKVLDQVGLFDEAFFMYGEDIDLSYRVTLAGYKNYYFADTTIIHYKGESTRKGSLNYVKVFYNAMIIFSRKHFSGGQSGFFSLFLNIAIFFRGFLTVLANLFSSSFLFIIDALLGFGGIYLIKTYWENMIKYTEHYYPNQFLFIVVPIYIFIWLVSTFISGGYDKPYRIVTIVRGIFLGTLAIAAVYAFLPNEWRFSRAMIILGAAWTAIEMIVTRTTYHLVKYQSFSMESSYGKKALLAGIPEECYRAEKLLSVSGADTEVLDFVSDDNKLRELVKLYDADEIIFCSRQLSFTHIMQQILLCGNKLDYKILNAGSEVFIGSNSKDTAGDLYSFNHSLKLSRPENQRRKRMFDIAACLVLLVLMPINIFLIPGLGRFLHNWFEVLLGRSTWVGYIPEETTHLPFAIKSVTSITGTAATGDLSAETIHKLNLLYAKHYSVSRDLQLLLAAYKQLGK